MRHRSLLTLMVILASTSAFAAKGKDDDSDKKKGGSSMDSGDPAATETSDKPKTEEGEKGEKGKDAKGDDTESEVAVEVNIPARARDKLVAFANILFGFGQAPVPGPTLTTLSYGYTGKSTVVTFIAGARYDFSPQFTAGIRVPFSVGSERQTYNPGVGTTIGSNALGAPELMGEYRVELKPRLNVPILFGLGIPVAQGEQSPYQDNQTGKNIQRRLQYMADAASGMRDTELFEPKRLPIILGGGIRWERNALQLHAEAKFVIPVKVSGDPPVQPNRTALGGTYTAKKIAFREVTGAGISYDVPMSPKFTLVPAADAWMVWRAIDTIEYKSDTNATPPSRIQFMFEPKIGMAFGKKPKIMPSIGYLFPLGGHLSDGKISALELHADVAF